MANRNSREEEEEEESSGDDRQHQLARQTFVDGDGYPLCFFIHESVKKPGARVRLAGDIEKHGGSVVEADTNADIVIIDDATADRDVQQLSYDVHRKKSMRHIYVEPMPFIQRCIRQGNVRHRVKERQGMGGVVGRTRTPFTEDDDYQLCRYLALRIPVKEAGGRSGDNVYKELEKLAAHQPLQYSWVKRHTWQSLRGRYKNKSAYFDQVIEHLVQYEQPTAKQRYFRDRAWRRGRPKNHQSDSDDEFHQENEGEDEEVFEPESELESEGGNEETSNNREPEIDNTVAAQRKRRRSENQRNSFPSASPAKRQRIERRSQASSAYHPTDPQTPAVPNKGKQRAQSQSDGENDDPTHQKSSLFSEDEDEDDAAGPSGTQHTPPPSPTLVPRRSSSPFFAPPQTSQTTIVATPQRISNKTGHIGASPQATPPEIPTLSNEQLDVSLNSHINPPRVRRIRNTSGPVIHSPPPVGDQQTEELPPIVVTHPSRRPATTKKKAKAKPVPLGPISIAPIPAIAEPPYRITRSRSRSVESSNAPTQPVPSKTRRRKDNKPVLLHLEPLKEAMEEENLEPLEELQDADQVTLTTRTAESMEERDVEDILVANATDISGVSQHQERLNPEIGDTSQESHDRRSVLSTDDEQADRTLRRVHELPRSQFPTSNIILADHPEDILKRLEVRSASSRRSSARPPFVVSNLAKTRAEGRASSSRVSHLAVDLNPQPSTPAHSRAPTRKRSTSSAESFPLMGTRASAMKRKIQEEEKNSPYTPPPGTRAAKHRK